MKRATSRDLSVFCRQMAVMYTSHITVIEGVKLVTEQTSSKRLNNCLRNVYKDMEAGSTFSESMSKYTREFDPYMLNMIHIGEMSGTLDTVFGQLATYYDKEDSTHRSIRSAITYPAILTILMIGIIVLMVLKILPMFQQTLTSLGGTVPAVTNVIFNVSDFLARYALWALGVVIVIIVAAYLYFRTRAGKKVRDTLKIKLPVFHYINIRIAASRYSRALQILLKSGVQLVNAMENVIPLINNKYLEKKFRRAYQKVKSGSKFAEVLGDVGIFPNLFLRMVSVGDATGHLEEMLGRSSVVFDEQLDDALGQLTLMIEPILIIALSCIVGIILLSIMLPMINIMNTIV